jgi:predicted nucleic acid-binding Zn ribbon protein
MKSKCPCCGKELPEGVPDGFFCSDECEETMRLIKKNELVGTDRLQDQFAKKLERSDWNW